MKMVCSIKLVVSNARSSTCQCWRAINLSQIIAMLLIVVNFHIGHNYVDDAYDYSLCRTNAQSEEQRIAAAQNKTSNVLPI